jgi:DNA polymerase I
VSLWFFPSQTKISVMEILVARTYEEIEFAYEKLSRATEIGCDTETSGLSPEKSKLFSVQFSDGEFNVLVPISEKISLGKLSQLLTNQQITTIFHNAKFDVNFLKANGYAVQNIYCTMIAEKFLTKGANQSVSLAETLYRYFAVDLDKSHRQKFNKTWDGIWTDELVDYALSDVIYLPKLMREQKDWLLKLGLKDKFYTHLQMTFNENLTIL